ncbi:hypothetical protein GCM10007923_13550 [Shinella yambaruensis]|uniref:Glycosyltransferase n=1 Tax=Shinella yambaruensis TaxID=415996 RepID=A0ABQ5ZET0_9HYPH|nr:hypothetical protein GCM10007923_13550 [Shinella yambaruensis]
MQAGSDLPAATGSSARLDLQPQNLGAQNLGTPARGWLWRTRRARVRGRTGAPLVYSRGESGRRPSYLRVLERLFGARRAGLRAVLLSRAPVLFLMVEEAFLLYVAVSLLRALTGRRTAGLLLRPMPLSVSSRRSCRWKRAVLRWLKRFRAIHTLTILPFSVFPAFSTIAKGWIYDFQLWDLTDEEREAVELLRSERQPGARLVLTAIGTQSRRKGFDLFTDSYVRVAALRTRFQFISCGRIERAVDDYAAAFREAGGVAVNRSVSDAELLGAYAASDAIWCFYPPIGDHASGVLGRAAQLGIPAVVRYGSLAHRLCIVENIPHVPMTADGIAERLAGPLPPRDEARGRLAADRFARQSEATLRAALGLAGTDPPTQLQA